MPGAFPVLPGEPPLLLLGGWPGGKQGRLPGEASEARSGPDSLCILIPVVVLSYSLRLLGLS